MNNKEWTDDLIKRKVVDLNKPFAGDLATYYGVQWVYISNKWYTLEEANNLIFEVGV